MNIIRTVLALATLAILSACASEDYAPWNALAAKAAGRIVDKELGYAK